MGYAKGQDVAETKVCSFCKKEYRKQPRRSWSWFHSSLFCGSECLRNYWASTVATRFWDRVDKTAGLDGCWLFTRRAGGYGDIRIHYRRVGAHRFAYEQAKGPVPEGLFVLHSCDNPRCVNPLHLRAGTAKDNAKDAIVRGRWDPVTKSGVRVGQKKLSTTCAYGHPWTPENTYTGFNHQRQAPLRVCRICSMKRARARYLATLAIAALEAAEAVPVAARRQA